MVACRAEPSARTKQAKLINSLTVCHSLKSILQLSLETFSSGSRHYRIILGWGETGWFTEKSVTMGSYLQIEGCASVKCILPPSLPPPFSALRPRMASLGDAHPRAGMGLDTSRFLYVSLANTNELLEVKPVLMRATTILPAPALALVYRNQDAIFKKEHRVSSWKF